MSVEESRLPILVCTTHDVVSPLNGLVVANRSSLAEEIRQAVHDYIESEGGRHAIMAKAAELFEHLRDDAQAGLPRKAGNLQLNGENSSLVGFTTQQYTCLQVLALLHGGAPADEVYQACRVRIQRHVLSDPMALAARIATAKQASGEAVDRLLDVAMTD